MMTMSGNEIRHEAEVNAQLRAEGWLTATSGDVNVYGQRGDWVAGGFQTEADAERFLRMAGANTANKREQQARRQRRYGR